MHALNAKALSSLLALASTVVAAPTYEAAVQCSRTAVLEATDAYVAAQTAGKLDALSNFLSSNWTYMENNKEGDAKKSVLVKALKIDNRRSIVDMTACATYTEIISADAANPYVIGTQIRFDDNLKIKMIDTIASTTNSWLFDVKKTLSYAQGEKWDVIPEGKRDSRKAIQDAGDAYMDIWSNSTAADLVPWGTPCARLEGGAYTAKGKPDDTCKTGIPSNHNQAPNTHRRYVIDETMGSVSIFCVWEHMMMAADSHEFRLEGGKLRFVHTMTVCGGQPCKLG